jgi:hypothetical protein
MTNFKEQAFLETLMMTSQKSRMISQTVAYTTQEITIQTLTDLH